MLNRLIICGQAKSHCVNWTVRDIVRDWQESKGDESLRDIFLCEDGMSSVSGCEEDGDSFIKEMRAMGLTVGPCREAFL